jgi:hypothetical protein
MEYDKLLWWENIWCKPPYPWKRENLFKNHIFRYLKSMKRHPPIMHP